MRRVYRRWASPMALAKESSRAGTTTRWTWLIIEHRADDEIPPSGELSDEGEVRLTVSAGRKDGHRAHAALDDTMGELRCYDARESSHGATA